MLKQVKINQILRGTKADFSFLKTTVSNHSFSTKKSQGFNEKKFHCFKKSVT